MIASTRRGVMAALLCGSVLGLAPPLRAAQTQPLPSPLRLPDGPLRLTRVLERGLGDGAAAAIIVERWWDIRFERLTRGIIVTGQQAGARVTAPPMLSELARLEQQRDASALFPLMLGDDGMILTTPTAPEASEPVAAARRAAEAVIASQTRLPRDERARISYYLGEIQSAGIGLLDALPGDLLFPTGERADRAETVPLPDGLTGQLTLSYLALAQPDAPWLARAERRVTTQIGTTRRSAVEIWTLAPV